MLFERSIQSHLKIGIGNEIELKRIKLLVTCAKYSLHFFPLSLCVSEREMASQKRAYFRIGWCFSIPILFVKHVPFRCLCKSGIFAPTPFCC